MADTRFTQVPGSFGDAGKPVSISKTEARQAVTLGSVRYVLGISLALAAVAFVIIFFFYA